jgi:hypothetical protein
LRRVIKHVVNNLNIIILGIFAEIIE